jgi:hypothetical protein
MKGGDKGGGLCDRPFVKLTIDRPRPSPLDPFHDPRRSSLSSHTNDMRCDRVGKDSTELLIQAVQRCVTGSTD